MMKCIKTGALVYLDQYAASIHCDAFLLAPGVLVLRTCPEMVYDHFKLYHFRVHNITQWFDKDERFGTLFADEYTDFGYDGKPAVQALI